MLNKDFEENKLKFKRVLTQWTLKHILSPNKESSDSPFIYFSQQCLTKMRCKCHEKQFIEYSNSNIFE